MKVAIIGSGSWGSALGMYLAKRGNEVKLWSYSLDELEMINKDHVCKFLPEAKFPENVWASNDFEQVLDGAEIILNVTPSKFVRDTLVQYKQFVKPEQPIVMCSKGFEPVTEKTFDVVVEEELPGQKFAVLSGPSHAEEVSQDIRTALVVASTHDDVLDKVRDLFASPIIRIYTSHDVKGVEIGGALKNIIAFCAGVCVGLGIGLGDNSFAALLTRGLVELSRLAVSMGAQEKTLYGLTGLGDLIVTCNSEHSRNRRAGKLIGQGKTIEETKLEVGQTIESFDNIEVAYSLKQKHNVEMPIVDVAYHVLKGELKPQDAVDILMTRNLREE